MTNIIIAFVIVIILVVILAELRVTGRDKKIEKLREIEAKKDKLFNDMLELNKEMVYEFEVLEVAITDNHTEDETIKMIGNARGKLEGQMEQE